jgi:phage tail sheath protein FI
MHNQKDVDNTLTTIGFTAPFPPLPANAPAGFLSQLNAIAQWDGTVSNVGTAAIEPVPTGTTVISTPPVLDLVFQTFNLPAPSLNLGLLSGGVAPANNTIRLVNQRIAVTNLRGLFTFFYNTVVSIETFVAAMEKSSEDSLIKAWPVYKGIIDAVNNNLTVLPPSGAMAGIYSRVDNERGVWKAPANVSVTLAKGTLVNITDRMQENINVDVNAGKSVNAIRVFAGKGVMVWGARTLAGNDNEWRYVSVRRFFNMVEESVKKSTSWVVFEPNDANSWVKLKSMIENYLTLLWRKGALAGAKPEEAFRVYVGLNQTMTFVDILEGRMIIRIEMAAVRPAEFIILEFAHKVQTS